MGVLAVTELFFILTAVLKAQTYKYANSVLICICMCICHTHRYK